MHRITQHTRRLVAALAVAIAALVTVAVPAYADTAVGATKATIADAVTVAIDVDYWCDGDDDGVVLAVLRAPGHVTLAGYAAAACDGKKHTATVHAASWRAHHYDAGDEAVAYTSVRTRAYRPPVAADYRTVTVAAE